MRDHSISGPASFTKSHPPRSLSLLSAVGLSCLWLVIVTPALYFFVTSRAVFSVDFYVYWHAGRTLLIQRQNPYASEARQDVQRAIYGEVASPQQDQMWFPNPPYSLIPVLPLIGLNYAWAHAAWLAFNLIFWVMGLRLTLPALSTGIISITIATLPVLVGLFMGNFSLLIASTITLIYYLIHRPSRPAHFGAGLLLFWITIKPLMAWLVIPLVLLITLRHKQYWVWIGWVVGGAICTILSWWWLPDWPFWWIQQIQAYNGNLASISIAALLSRWILPMDWVPWGTMLIRLTALGGSVLWLWRWWRGLYPDVLALATGVWLTQMLHIHMGPIEHAPLLVMGLAWWETASPPRAWYWIGLGVLAWLGPWFVFAVLFRGYQPIEVILVWPTLCAIWLILAMRAWTRRSAYRPRKTL
jgi:hypothetical protein